MSESEAFMAVLNSYYESAKSRYRQKVDEYREVRDDPESTPEELEDAKVERRRSAIQRHEIQNIIARIEYDVRELLQRDAMGEL